MRTVVIVGAGGTLAHAEALRATRRRYHPPLDGTFFERSASLAKYDRVVKRRVTEFKRALSTSGMFYDPWTYPSPPMEQFFADVYYEVASEDERAFPVFVELLHLYAVVLGATTNWMGCRPRAGLLGKLLRSEIDLAGGDEVSVITFNQDLVLENELSALPSRYGEVFLHTLYGDPGLDGLFGRGVASDERFQLRPPDESAVPVPVKLYKLHGSLNWMLRTRNSDPEVGTLFPRDRRRERSVFVLDRRVIADNQMMNTEAGAGRSRWYLWPLVVPPIYDKQRIVAMDLLRSIWDKARQSLAEADRVVLLGYSLPDADIQARQMLRAAFTTNPRLDAIDCINPDATLGARLKSTLNTNVVRMYHDLASYLAEHRQLYQATL
jgi:hypothetical protein